MGEEAPGGSEVSAKGIRTSSVIELVIEAVKLTAVEERRRCVSQLVDTGPATSRMLAWDLQPPVYSTAATDRQEGEV